MSHSTTLRIFAGVICAAFLLLSIPSWTQENTSYAELLAKWKTKRPKSTEPYFDKEVPNSRQIIVNRIGKDIQRIILLQRESGNQLKEAVMQSGTVGKVYPGSLVWINPLSEGRIEQVTQLQVKQKYTVTTSGIRLKSQYATDSVSFIHDGSFANFQDYLTKLIPKIDSTAPRLYLQFETGKSIESALLKLGLSANAFGASLAIDTSENAVNEYSFAVMSLNEVYFDITSTLPNLNGYLTSLTSSQQHAKPLLSKMTLDGELGYVRRVSYGRRVLISFAVEAREEALRQTLDASYSTITGSGKGKITKEMRALWKSMTSQAVIIGGKVTPSLMKAVSGDIEKFKDNIAQYLKETAVWDDKTGALPIAFEVSYLDDNIPYQTFETNRFDGRIPGKRYPGTQVIKDMHINVDSAWAKLIAGDHEIDSDDWTGIKVRYNLSIASDRKSIKMHLCMDAIEESRHKQGPDDTQFRTERTFDIFRLNEDDERIIVGLDAVRAATAMEHIRGEQHGWVSFNKGLLGALHDVQVHFDGPSSNDTKEQGINVNLNMAIKFNLPLKD